MTTRGRATARSSHSSLRSQTWHALCEDANAVAAMRSITVMDAVLRTGRPTYVSIGLAAIVRTPAYRIVGGMSRATTGSPWR
jgi:hypothetical protein